MEQGGDFYCTEEEVDEFFDETPTGMLMENMNLHLEIERAKQEMATLKQMYEVEMDHLLKKYEALKASNKRIQEHVWALEKTIHEHQIFQEPPVTVDLTKE